MRTLLIGITALVLAAVAATVIVGTRTFDGLVVERPYEKGLAWDAERRARTSLGWQVAVENVRLTVGRNVLTISVRDALGRDRTDALSRLTVSRPASVRFDRNYTVPAGAQGRAPLRVDFPRFGHWDLKFHLRTDAGERVLEKRVYVEEVAPPEGKRVASTREVNCIPRAGPCIQRIPMDDLQVQLAIDPPGVATMAPLTFRVLLSDNDGPVTDATLALSLSMPGMVMGPNRPVLNHRGAGRYEGKGILPRCASGGKLWQAEITMARQGRTLSSAFLFEAE